IIVGIKIDATIRSQVEASGSFNWNDQSASIIWSALQHSDNIMSVGYKPDAISGNIDASIHLLDIQSDEWRTARETLLQQILAEEQKLDATLTLEKIIPWNEAVLPVINIEVKNPSAIKMLKASRLVRYAEPMGYEPRDVMEKVMSSSGCDNSPSFDLVANSDYNIITPNSKQSWNHSFHKIPQAWAKSTGAGVKVFIVDTGSENDQENLGSAFNQGLSTGRTIEKTVTLPRPTFFGIPTGPVETPDDGCGHGTSMAGACAAPRGTDGNSCGVAYNANLVTCRASSDVLFDESREAKGVADAFTKAGGSADVKIISMSMGRITSSSQVADAVRYAYGKGKLIFCAAGTSFSWTSGWYGVIFPATMNEVNAVTGVRDNSFGTTCTTCHDGSQTDFTIVMEKASNGRHPLTLAMTGDIPSTVGGSSVATATAAGIGALV
ncbi:MAG: serine protease, partial [Sphingobacteriales bacterium]